MPPVNSKRDQPRFSHLSRMLISQSNDMWDFHVSWCRFVTPNNHHHSDRPHKHSLYEMQFVTEGSLSLFVQGETKVLPRGKWIIIPPQALHHLRFNQQDTQKLVIGFSVNKLAPRIEASMQAEYFLQVYDSTETMNYLVNALREQEKENRTLSPYVISGLIQSFILEALNLHSPLISPVSNVSQKNSISDQRVDASIQYIQSNISYAITAQEVADHIGINLRHLNRLFHNVCGQSVYQQIQQIRMKHAQMLLETTSMSLSDVAESMDFSSVYAFSRAFKSVCGVPPGKFQHDAAAR